MRTREQVQAYESKLEDHYLNTGKIMTDLEIQNANIKIKVALRAYRDGLDRDKIIEVVKGVPSIALSNFEKAQQRIHKELLSRGYESGTEKFKNKELELLVKWGKTYGHAR